MIAEMESEAKKKEVNKDKTLKNIYINLVVTGLISVLTFLLNRYFALHMGADTLGLMRLFTQLIAYISLAELGIGAASAYALYKPLTEGDTSRVNVVLSTIEALYMKVALGVALIGVLANFLLPSIINSNVYGNKLYIYWTLYVLNTAFTYVFAKYSILLTADHEYGFVRKMQGIGRISIQLLQIFVIIKYQSFTIYIFIIILENVFLYLSYKSFFKEKYSHFTRVKERDHTITKNISNLFWHQIGGVVVYNTDYIVISKFLTLGVIGVYSSYLMVYQMMILIIGIITPVLVPNIGHFIAQNTKEDIFSHWQRLNSMYYFMGSVLVCITYYLINPFIVLWVGESYLLPQTTVLLLMVNLFIQTTGSITGVFKNSSGFFDDIYAPILESLINLALSIYLVQIIGLNGVIIGTIASNFLVIFLLRHILVFNRCFHRGITDFAKHVGKYTLLIGGGILAIKIILPRVVQQLLGGSLNPNNLSNGASTTPATSMISNLTIFNWMKEGVVTFIVIVLIFSIIFAMDKSFRNMIVCGILPKFKRRK